MGTLSADSNPIVVAGGPYVPGLPTTGARGSTTIRYSREVTETVWENAAGGGWTPVAGPGPGAPSGTRTPSIRIGQIYEAAVYAAGDTPTSGAAPTAYVRVGAIARNARRPLITSRTFARGGTWCGDAMRTSALTHIVAIGSDTTPLTIDALGLPRFRATATLPAVPIPPSRRQLHTVDLVGLPPGMSQTYAVVVSTSRGEWDVAYQTFTTLRRRVSVSFPRITILNDGDNDAYIFGRTFPDPGEANFWFRVRYGSGAARSAQTFQTHRIPIYDGRAHGIRTGIPLPTTVAWADGPRAIPRGEGAVYAESWALEHDPPFGADAADSILGTRGALPLPLGRGENASGSLTLNCLPASAGSPLHYTTDVSWNVAYVP